ncbi:MAG: EAL domain-containing protein [Gammaproteobacteria bacterium]|nr:EAL domain-containing protein [Gammaproteobacteria bacterium]
MTRITSLEDSDNEAIVDAVITLAKSLRIETIAEGVETKAQFDSLTNKDYNQMQGYYFSKPISGEQFVVIARNSGSRQRSNLGL